MKNENKTDEKKIIIKYNGMEKAFSDDNIGRRQIMSLFDIELHGNSIKEDNKLLLSGIAVGTVIGLALGFLFILITTMWKNEKLTGKIYWKIRKR